MSSGEPHPAASRKVAFAWPQAALARLRDERAHADALVGEVFGVVERRGIDANVGGRV